LISVRLWVLLGAAVLLAAALFAFALFPPKPLPDKVDLLPYVFVERLSVGRALRGWEDDDQAPALAAFRLSCERLLRLPDDRAMGDTAFGTVGDWRPACTAALADASSDPESARAFFQTWFRPVAIRNNGDDVGLFTGYYEPQLQGHPQRGGPYQVPIYAPPPDYVTVDLGEFRPELKGQRIVGKIAGNRLRPAETRAEIENGALDGRAEILLWVDDPVDAFFLHIQGSGLVTMSDGTIVRIGYAGTNGHVYHAIGRSLVARGELTQDEVSMQSIRAWLGAHPNDAAALMNENASYIFFRKLDGDAPIGAQGVPLTAGRSLAIDRTWLPLGMPVWLDTVTTDAQEGADDPLHFRRLMVAQDTGGAIRGIVRGDVYWGAGDDAANRAGRMRVAGRYFGLLPRTLLERQARGED
jgi:membrane-bound lytic murein transglycosylase A